MIIYRVTNMLNGKIYVGKSIYDDPTYLGSGLLIKRAIEKYGLSNFRKDTLEVCETEEQLNEREKFWIQKLDSQNKAIGYNIAEGGTGGRTLPEPWNKGKKEDSEITAKRAKALTGLKQSEETKQKRRIALTGRVLSSDHCSKIAKSNTGKAHSEATRDLLRAYALAQFSDPEARRRLSEARKDRVASIETRQKQSSGVKKAYELNPDAWKKEPLSEERKIAQGKACSKTWQDKSEEEKAFILAKRKAGMKAMTEEAKLAKSQKLKDAWKARRS